MSATECSLTGTVIALIFYFFLCSFKPKSDFRTIIWGSEVSGIGTRIFDLKYTNFRLGLEPIVCFPRQLCVH